MLAAMVFDYEIEPNIDEIETFVNLLNIEMQNPVMLQTLGVGHSFVNDCPDNIIVDIILKVASSRLLSRIDIKRKKRFYIVKFM